MKGYLKVSASVDFGFSNYWKKFGGKKKKKKYLNFNKNCIDYNKCLK